MIAFDPAARDLLALGLAAGLRPAFAQPPATRR